jgi:hypothetical protein
VIETGNQKAGVSTDDMVAGHGKNNYSRADGQNVGNVSVSGLPASHPSICMCEQAAWLLPCSSVGILGDSGTDAYSARLHDVL